MSRRRCPFWRCRRPRPNRKSAPGGGKRSRKGDAGLEELRAELGRLWGEGLAPKKIAKKLKRSEAWVYLNAKVLKLPPRGQTADGALARPLPRRPAAGSVKARRPKPESAPVVAQRPSAPLAATSAAAGPELAAHELLKFLREIGHKASATAEAGQYIFEGKKVDAIGLLEAANAWRRRNAQPPFSLKAG